MNLFPPSPISICENIRKSYKIMHCFDFILSDSFKDMDIFSNFNSDGGGGVEYAH